MDGEAKVTQMSRMEYTKVNKDGSRNANMSRQREQSRESDYFFLVSLSSVFPSLKMAVEKEGNGKRKKIMQRLLFEEQQLCTSCYPPLVREKRKSATKR